MKRKRFLQILVATLLPFLLTAQHQVTTIAQEAIIKLNDNDFADALADFKKGEARLYCQGGLSPIVDRKLEKRFYKKYTVTYHDFGCIGAGDSFKKYNLAIFELLSFKYGDKWQNLVRPDAIGYNEWASQRAN